MTMNNMKLQLNTGVSSQQAKALFREKKISKFWLFIGVVTFIKLILMGVCSSDYQNELFFPFVIDFMENGGNVYQRFYDQGITNAFPYPIMMLLLQSIGAMLINVFGVTSLFWTNFLFKVPSLLIDIISLLILIRLYADKRRYIAVFYYGSPIIFYAVYMHGQLDLIPTMLMLIAVLALTSKEKNRHIIGALFTAVAILCKTHILALLPIVILYLFNKDGIKHTLQYGVIVLCGVLLGILPVMSQGFIETVLFNTEQGVLTDVYFNFASAKLYIPIMAVFMIYLIAAKLQYINNELFFSLCGIVLAMFLALCPPMAGWYVWIVPYIAVFFATTDAEKYKNIHIYILLNILYLCYFVFLHNKGMVDLYLFDFPCSMLKIESTMFANLGFTLLSATLLYLVYSMYRIGVADNLYYKRKNAPFTIGISGDSGAGKTTMIKTIEKCLGTNNLQYIEGDGDHRWERGDDNWNSFTALNPKANYLYRQAEELKSIRAGSAVRRVDYDHDTGKFTEKKRVKVKRFMVLCGLHSMYLPQTRQYLDLKIYMDADETLRRFWKIQRDTAKRGYTKEASIKQIEGRMPDARKYIYPQKEYADMIVRYYDKNLTDCMVDKHDVKISLQFTISAAVNVEPLVEALKYNGIHVQYDYSEDLKNQIVNVDGDDMENIKLPVGKIADRVVPRLDEITRENLDGEMINGKDAVVILFLLLMISSKMQEEYS